MTSLAKPEYNISCSLSISIFVSSHQNSVVVYTFMGVANGLSSITALVGNIIILLALRRCTSLHPTSKSLFYSLAVSDLAIGLVGQPLFSVYLVSIASDNPRLFCAVGLPHSLITTFLGTVSLWTLTVIAFDRYLALRLRFRYRSVMKVHRIAVVLITGWLFLALGTASRIFSIKPRQIIGNLVFPICVMFSSYFYIRTYLSLRQHKLKIQGQSSFNLAHYRKSLNSMFFVFCLFLTSCLPFTCALAATTASGFNNLKLLILDITSVIALLNPSLNPLVYCWRIRDLKLEALRILRKLLSCCPATSRRRYSFRVTSNNKNLTSLT